MLLLRDKVNLNSLLTLIFALMIGASFAAGTMFIAFQFVFVTIVLGMAARGSIPRLNRGEIFLLLLFGTYYIYFGLHELIHPGSYGRVRFFVENITFLTMPFIIAIARDLDIDAVIKLMAKLLLPAIAFVLVWVIVEKYVYGYARVAGPSRDILTLALFVLAGVHFSMMNWHNENRIWKFGAICAWMIGLIIVAKFAEARACMLYFLVCGTLIVVYVFCSTKFGWKKNLFRIAAIFVLGVILSSIALYIMLKFDLFPRLTGLLEYFRTGQHSSDASAGFRKTMWSLVWENRSDVPFFGVGIGRPFSLIAQDWPFDVTFRQLHNDFLNHIVGGGIPGVVLYLAMVLFPLIYLFDRNARSDRFIYFIVMLVLILILSGLTNRTFYHYLRLPWIATALGFAHLFYRFEIKKTQQVTD